MTKKLLIAAAKHICELNRLRKYSEALACYSLILDIHGNPNFDLDKFRKACGFSK